MNGAPNNADDESNEVGMHISAGPNRTEIEQPHTSGAREVSGLPFRILLVSDLVPGASPEAGRRVTTCTGSTRTALPTSWPRWRRSCPWRFGIR
jgi:hypothetical protein